MSDSNESTGVQDSNLGRRRCFKLPSIAKLRRRRRVFRAVSWLAFIAVLTIASAAWLASRATIIKDELEATAHLIPKLKDSLASDKLQEATAISERLRPHTTANH